MSKTAQIHNLVQAACNDDTDKIQQILDSTTVDDRDAVLNGLNILPVIVNGKFLSAWQITALIGAVTRNHTNAARALVDAGAEKNASAGDQITAPKIARELSNNDPIRELLGVPMEADAPPLIAGMFGMLFQQADTEEACTPEP